MILVRVGNLAQIYVLPSHEALDLSPQNFLDARESEEKEGVGNLADIQLAESEDERELMLLVVS